MAAYEVPFEELNPLVDEIVRVQARIDGISADRIRVVGALLEGETTMHGWREMNLDAGPAEVAGKRRELAFALLEQELEDLDHLARSLPKILEKTRAKLARRQRELCVAGLERVVVTWDDELCPRLLELPLPKWSEHLDEGRLLVGLAAQYRDNVGGQSLAAGLSDFSERLPDGTWLPARLPGLDRAWKRLVRRGERPIAEIVRDGLLTLPELVQDVIATPWVTEALTNGKALRAPKGKGKTGRRND